MSFDPNSASSPDSGVFGLPHSPEEASLVIVPVPWEATVSYGGGTSRGPGAILKASRQVDLFDYEIERPYEAGIHMLAESDEILGWNATARLLAQRIIEKGGDIAGDKGLEKALVEVNILGEKMNRWVSGEVDRWLSAGKIVGVVGGDHSVPFGAIEAATRRHDSLGILHFDAHSDTRNAFEGFTWSHASIFRNVLDRLAGVTRVVQVGIRDFCEQEWEYCREQGSRVAIYFDAELQKRKFQGESWAKISSEIVSKLPDDVWVSFDIDGLDPRFCPHTGTPVPGGLEFAEAVWLIGEVVRSGKKIVGFDLNEVAPGPAGTDEWDGNVGARLLYKLCAWTLASQGKAPQRSA